MYTFNANIAVQKAAEKNHVIIGLLDHLLVMRVLAYPPLGNIYKSQSIVLPGARKTFSNRFLLFIPLRLSRLLVMGKSV